MRSIRPAHAEPFPSEQRQEVKVDETPYVRFDLNDYSVPHTHVRSTVTVLATGDGVRIVDGQHLLAHHRRSYDAGEQVEIRAHIEALAAHKRASSTHRAQDRLHPAAANAKTLFLQVEKLY